MPNHSPTLRSARLAGLASVAALLVLPIALPGTAAAADAPGNNGTLKVHEPGTPFERNASESQQPICAFYLAGFNFDSNQVISYSFTVQGGANSGDPEGTPGSFTAGPDNGRPRGDGRTPVLEKTDHTLPDGRYKVTVTTTDGSKSKVFEINCPGGNNPEPPGTVGGVGQPDEDDGPGGVGGVDTGGGGLSGGATDVAFPLTAMALAGAIVGAQTLRRRRSN
ncbi:hypothetical protein [Sporichthya sp.]|uniref:hypothetical protein n=1 Tax=Sporichthya sp. TaxID=65475 RepID=UPI00182DAE24|nr:hypothetical protein [Sporichthya sp.]MBA3744292.1 hypothetical protein [Sporichthya sp.]